MARCSQCGNSFVTGGKCCEGCKRKKREQRLAKSQAGLCSGLSWCQNQPAPGRKRCLECARYYAEKNRQCRSVRPRQSEGKPLIEVLDDYDSIL
jgi:hypothetical protein